MPRQMIPSSKAPFAEYLVNDYIYFRQVVKRGLNLNFPRSEFIFFQPLWFYRFSNNAMKKVNIELETLEESLAKRALLVPKSGHGFIKSFPRVSLSSVMPQADH